MTERTDLPGTDLPGTGLPGTGLAGRRGQAARNDTAILAAARAVFLADPKAPVSAVADRAGVGISALYRRYAGKDDLLRRLCHDGLLQFIAEAEAAIADPDAWAGLATFLRRVVVADLHSLIVHLAGTFTPTAQMRDDALRTAAVVAALVDRAHASGQLRADAGVGDVQLALEGGAAIRIPDAGRTTELKLRYLALALDGLAADGAASPPLPFTAPQMGEMNWRWGWGAEAPGQ
jgi:AcrR family transcriptional regulator